MNSKEKAKIICHALEEKKGMDIKVIDIHEVSVLADYFIIASASNPNQLLAMKDEVEEKLYEKKIHPKAIEGNRDSSWILMDYQDVVVHLFPQDQRIFYDLERIWRDGVMIDSEEL